MALIKCPECGKENISDSAISCPYCGYGVREHTEKLKARESQKKQEPKQQTVVEQKPSYHKYLKDVRKPEKPKISPIGLVTGIVIGLFAAYQLATSDEDLVFFWLIFLFTGIGTIGYTVNFYSKQKELYDLAQKDFESYKILAAKEQEERSRNYEIERALRQNAPKCPMCNSTNIEKISTVNRAASVAVAGLASGKIGKQYKCKNCKHMW